MAKDSPIKDVYAHWPEVTADTLQSIGRFVVAWGALEGQISNAIADVYDFNEVTMLSVTANLGTKAKLELFMSGIAVYREWLIPSVDIRDLNKLATDTADTANKYRNLLAHGQPIPFPREETDDNPDDQPLTPPKQDWIWGRYSARKGGVKMTATRLKQYYFEQATAETVTLIDRWTQFRLDASGFLRFGHQEMREQYDE